MKVFIHTGWLLFCFTFWSCANNKTVSATLDAAEFVMRERPDSALKILQTLDDRPISRGTLQARYALLYTQALDKNDISISTNHLIHFAVDFFDGKRDYRRLCLAYFYLGKAYEQMDSILLATQIYVKAQELLSQVNDDYVTGLVTNKMASLYQKQRDYEHTLSLLKQSLSCFQRAGDAKNEGIVLSQIARLFFLEGSHADSIHYYYDKARVIAEERNDMDFLYSILLSKAAVLQEHKEYLQAYRLFNDAIQEYKQGVIPVDYYPLLSMLYLNFQQIDSARHYMQMVLTVPQATQKQRTGAFAGLKRIEEQAGNKQEAEYYGLKYKALSDSIQDERYIYDVRIVAQNHHIESLKNENLLRKKQHVGTMVTFVVLFLICATGIIYVAMRYISRHKQQQANILRQQQELIKKQEQMEERLFKSLSHWDHGLFVKKVNSVNIDMTKEAGSAKVISIANIVYPGLTEWLKNHCPEISDDEIALTCLLFSDLSHKHINSLYSESRLSSHYVRASRLYEKLGIKTDPKDPFSFRKRLDDLYVRSVL